VVSLLRRLRPAVVTGVTLALLAFSTTACGFVRPSGDEAGTTGLTAAGPGTVVAPVAPAVEPWAPAVEDYLITADGRQRTYRAYVPSTMGADPVPLLVALHGVLGSGEQFERQTGFDGLAEANRFVVVYPDGLGTGPDGTAARAWNAGGCCGEAQREQVDDVAFMASLVAALRSRFPIDANRVFAVGHSNGGMLAYRLACQGPGPFAAVAAQSAALLVDGCRPDRPVSLEHLHGTADETVPLAGDQGSQSIAGVTLPPAHDGAVAVAAADGCPPSPARTTGEPGLTVETWAPCRSGTEVRFVTVAGASHAWMGSPRAGSAGGAMDASTELWSFLVAHPRQA
jgi:polyhydroxybutyrate depolymerase